ncbi:MAG: hypothetical protein ACI4BB_09805 [Coprococcus sp.]
MKNLKRMTGFILMCIIVVTMAGAAMASVNSTSRTGTGTVTDTVTGTENGVNGNVNETGTVNNNGNNAGNNSRNTTENNTAGSETNGNAKGGEIASFNNYGMNGNYTALGEYEVAYGSNLSEVTSKLPSTLTATLTTGEEVEVPVTWVCVSDNAGGTAYLPEHEDVTVAYTFEAKLGEGYTLANNLPGDYIMPFATVRYTENAQQLNSNVVESGIDAVTEATTGGMSGWTWIIWIIVIVIVIVVLWWLFAGSKGKDGDNN